jgi:hypothetical protein
MGIPRSGAHLAVPESPAPRVKTALTHPYLTESGCKVVLKKSILPQISQVIFYYYQYKE